MSDNQQNQKEPLGDRLLGLIIAICIGLWLIANCAMPSINEIRNSSSEQSITAPNTTAE